MLHGRVLVVLFTLFSVSNGKSFLGMCSMLRNEKRWVRSWIEWHLMVGVDHFFMLDDKSDDGTTAILEEYSNMGLLTFLNPDQRRETLEDTSKNTLEGYFMNSSFENASATKIIDENEDEYLKQLAFDLDIDLSDNETHAFSKSGHIFENGEVVKKHVKLCYDQAGPNFEWMIMTDTDEFMFPLDDGAHSTCSIAHYLRTRCQARQTHVPVRWTMFGSNGFTFHPQGTLPETHFWSGGDCTSSALHGSSARKCDAHSGRRLDVPSSPAQNLTIISDFARRRLSCKWIAFKHRMECSQDPPSSSKHPLLEEMNQAPHAEGASATPPMPKSSQLENINQEIRTKKTHVATPMHSAIIGQSNKYAASFCGECRHTKLIANTGACMKSSIHSGHNAAEHWPSRVDIAVKGGNEYGKAVCQAGWAPGSKSSLDSPDACRSAALRADELEIQRARGKSSDRIGALLRPRPPHSNGKDCCSGGLALHHYAVKSAEAMQWRKQRGFRAIDFTKSSNTYKRELNGAFTPAALRYLRLFRQRMQKWHAQSDSLRFHDVGSVACSVHKGMGIMGNGAAAIIEAGGSVRHTKSPVGEPNECCEACVKNGRCDVFEYDFQSGSCALIQLNDRGSYLGLHLTKAPNTKTSGVVIVNECGRP